MNRTNSSTSIRVLLIIAAVAVLVFGALRITGAAAQVALPGDALYPVKTSLEQTRLSLAQDAGDRAQMKLAFADQRLTEISGLIKEGRYREIPDAVLAFEANINAAILELETVAQSDPARAARIAQEVTSALTRYASTLSGLAASAPDSVKSEVNRALDTTHVVNGLELPSANANDNNANGNENGNANNNENDPNGNDNANSANDNPNSNDDDGGDDNNNNHNGNENGNVNDDNGNDNQSGNSSDENGNGNDNANDNANDNSNDNADDSGNDNGDDKGGLNDNENTNSSSGSDGNDNDNDDNDDNDNDDDDSSGKGRGRGRGGDDD